MFGGNCWASTVTLDHEGMTLVVASIPWPVQHSLTRKPRFIVKVYTMQNLTLKGTSSSMFDIEAAPYP